MVAGADPPAGPHGGHRHRRLSGPGTRYLEATISTGGGLLDRPPSQLSGGTRSTSVAINVPLDGQTFVSTFLAANEEEDHGRLQFSAYVGSSYP